MWLSGPEDSPELIRLLAQLLPLVRLCRLCKAVRGTIAEHDCDESSATHTVGVVEAITKPAAFMLGSLWSCKCSPACHGPGSVQVGVTGHVSLFGRESSYGYVPYFASLLAPYLAQRSVTCGLAVDDGLIFTRCTLTQRISTQMRWRRTNSQGLRPKNDDWDAPLRPDPI